MKSLPWLAAALFPMRLAAVAAEDAAVPSPPPDGIHRDRLVDAAKPAGDGVIENDNHVLVDRLKGVAVALDAAGALRLQAATRSGVAIDGFSERDSRKIRASAEEHLGKPVTLGSLNRMLDQLTEVSREAGFVLQRVSFPAQEITSGVVAVRMGPAVVGSVKVAGRPAFGRAVVRDTFRSRPGEALDEGKILDDIDWLNRNPLRRATIVHAPGEDDDALNLTLRVRAEKTWRAYGGIDNQLSETLGDERLYVGYQHGNVSGLDHRFTGQVTSALESDRLLGASIIHQIPLPGRHLLEFAGGFTKSETGVAGPLDQSGEFTRAAVNHRMQLPRWHGIAHEWRSGMEFRYNDYLFPNGDSATVRFFQLETGWEGRRSDDHGTTRLGLLALYSPGQGVLGSEDSDFIALGADGADSLILRMNLERKQKLGDFGSLVARARGQWSDSELLSSDQIYAGGMSGVRGYDEVIGYSSNGLVGGIEWQSPFWKHDVAGDWMGLVFVDGALLDREQSIDTGELLSAGFGCRFRWKELTYGRIDIGFPLECPDTVDSDPMIHFAIGMNW